MPPFFKQLLGSLLFYRSMWHLHQLLALDWSLEVYIFWQNRYCHDVGKQNNRNQIMQNFARSRFELEKLILKYWRMSFVCNQNIQKWNNYVCLIWNKSQISSNYRVCKVKANRTKTKEYFWKKGLKNIVQLRLEVILWRHESLVGFHCCQLENEFLTLILLA